MHGDLMQDRLQERSQALMAGSCWHIWPLLISDILIFYPIALAKPEYHQTRLQLQEQQQAVFKIYLVTNYFIITV